MSLSFKPGMTGATAIAGLDAGLRKSSERLEALGGRARRSVRGARRGCVVGERDGHTHARRASRARAARTSRRAARARPW